MIVIHIDDWLVHERIEVNVLRRHQRHAVENLCRFYLCRKLFLEFGNQLLSLMVIYPRKEGGVIKFVSNEALSSQPRGDGKDNLVFKV